MFLHGGRSWTTRVAQAPCWEGIRERDMECVEGAARSARFLDASGLCGNFPKLPSTISTGRGACLSSI